MTSRPPAVAAVILAAGRSSRMGAVNKLTAGLGGLPVLRHVAEACLGSRARPVHVVTGHEAPQVEATLAGLEVRIVHNPDFRDGMSTSLRCGILSLPEHAAGAVICLGDMPRVSAAVIDALIDGWRAGGAGTICVPVRSGRRGNPVLIDRAYFAELTAIEGDVGARALISAHAERVHELEISDDGIFTDVDTPQELAAVRGSLARDQGS